MCVCACLPACLHACVSINLSVHISTCSVRDLLEPLLRVRPTGRIRLHRPDPGSGGHEHLHPEPGSAQQRRQPHHLRQLQHQHVRQPLQAPRGSCGTPQLAFVLQLLFDQRYPDPPHQQKRTSLMMEISSVSRDRSGEWTSAETATFLRTKKTCPESKVLRDFVG